MSAPPVSKGASFGTNPGLWTIDRFIVKCALADSQILAPASRRSRFGQR
jgi:hypothetical protein